MRVHLDLPPHLRRVPEEQRFDRHRKEKTRFRCSDNSREFNFILNMLVILMWRENAIVSNN